MYTLHVLKSSSRFEFQKNKNPNNTLFQGQIIETKHINEAMENNNFQEKLQKICEKSTGLSGRTLRKIPFIAHALFLHRTPVSLEEFLEAMDKAIDREKKERKHFENLK